MPVVKNEQEVKRESLFLKYLTGDQGNSLKIKSHLYSIPFHYLNQFKKSVLCKGKECSYCSKGFQRRTEYNYYVLLNGDLGVMDIKPSVFFAIQGIVKVQKKDPRQISWTIIKKGEGINTEYTTSKDDNLTQKEFDQVNAEVEANTEKLTQIMLKREEQLYNQYSEFEPQVGNAYQQPAVENEEPPMPEEGE